MWALPVSRAQPDIPRPRKQTKSPCELSLEDVLPVNLTHTDMVSTEEHLLQNICVNERARPVRPSDSFWVYAQLDWCFGHSH